MLVPAAMPAPLAMLVSSMLGGVRSGPGCMPNFM